MRLEHVLPPHAERVDAQLAAHLIDGGFDGKYRLRGAVATESARWGGIGIDGITHTFFVLTPVGGHGGTQR